MNNFDKSGVLVAVILIISIIAWKYVGNNIPGSSAFTIPPFQPSGVVIYLSDSVNASDLNSGLTTEEPLRTFTKAVAVASTYKIAQINIDGSHSSSSGDDHMFHIADQDNGKYIEVSGSLIIKPVEYNSYNLEQTNVSFRDSSDRQTQGSIGFYTNTDSSNLRIEGLYFDMLRTKFAANRGSELTVADCDFSLQHLTLVDENNEIEGYSLVRLLSSYNGMLIFEDNQISGGAIETPSSVPWKMILVAPQTGGRIEIANNIVQAFGVREGVYIESISTIGDGNIDINGNRFSAPFCELYEATTTGVVTNWNADTTVSNNYFKQSPCLTAVRIDEDGQDSTGLGQSISLQNNFWIS